jgi:hypothetical protein
MPIPGKTIDFVIIGAAKAGTTSLASWLGLHPDVCMSNPKETMFFGSPKLFDQGVDAFHSEFFSHYQGESLIGEATPAYSNRDRHPGTADRVYSINPLTKIIYIVRHPLQKVESSWQMYTCLDPFVVKTNEHRISCLKAAEGFAAYIREPSIFANLVNVCKYAYQLKPWQDIFDPRAIHVMFLEDVASDRDGEIVRLCNFLCLDPQPLLFSVDLKPQNTLKQRRYHRPFMRYLLQTGLQKFLPSSVKEFLANTSLVSVSQRSRLKPVWPSEYLEQFVEEIEQDVKSFLKAHGKRKDFYLFQRSEV